MFIFKSTSSVVGLLFSLRGSLSAVSQGFTEQLWSTI